MRKRFTFFFGKKKEYNSLYSRPLENGDIINIDITVYLNCYHGDTSKTFLVGQVDDVGKKLVSKTLEVLNKAIHICGPGVPFYKIGQTISECVGTEYSIQKDFCGHGIGKMV